jgi:hypothetical protein
MELAVAKLNLLEGVIRRRVLDGVFLKVPSEGVFLKTSSRRLAFSRASRGISRVLLHRSYHRMQPQHQTFHASTEPLIPRPNGTPENSPALQRWVMDCSTNQSRTDD